MVSQTSDLPADWRGFPPITTALDRSLWGFWDSCLLLPLLGTNLPFVLINLQPGFEGCVLTWVMATPEASSGLGAVPSWLRADQSLCPRVEQVLPLLLCPAEFPVSGILQPQYCCPAAKLFLLQPGQTQLWLPLAMETAKPDHRPLLHASWLQIPAVHDFGLFMSLIVTCCWLAVLFTMPAALGLWSLYMAPLESSCQSR